VIGGWDRNRSRLHLAVRAQHLVEAAKSAAAELVGDGIGAGKVGINHADQADRFAIFGELMVHTRVVAAECAHANDYDWNRTGFGQTIS
jgi:hypothetical protein